MMLISSGFRKTGEKYKEAIKTLFKASSYYNQNYLKIMVKCFELRKQHGFLPQEAFTLGLLDPSVSQDEISGFCSSSRFIRYQLFLNPISYVGQTENKGFFHKICKLSKIETPDLIAVFFKKNLGYDYDNKFIRNKEEWILFLNNRLPPDFVIKPSSGSHGSNVNMFIREGHEFLDHKGKRYTAENIYNLMNSNESFDSFIIEQRVENHHDFSSLSKTKALQTIRFITYIDTNNTAKILFAYMKIANEKNIIDNLDSGKTGNFLAEIDTEGRLKEGITMIPGNPGIKRIINHPDSQNKIEGFQIPLWDETVAFVKTVAPKFLPVRFVGWDVAVTEDGPKLLEGNFMFDIPKFHGKANELIKSVEIDNDFYGKDPIVWRS